MAKHKRSYLERSFERLIVIYKVPVPVREYVFRKYRFDFAWPYLKIAVEVDGGTFMKDGGHARGIRYQKDCLKNNLAQAEGWVVLRVDREIVLDSKMSRDFFLQLRSVIITKINTRKNRGREKRIRNR